MPARKSRAEGTRPKPAAVMPSPVVISASGVEALIEALFSRGYEVVAPAKRDGAIVFDKVEVGSVELPKGWTLEQEPGYCRLKKRDDDALFGYVPGPRSLKSFLHPSEIRFLEAKREDGLFQILGQPAESPRLAFVGVRPCDLAAVKRLDRVLLEDRFQDTFYRAKREAAFLVVVECTEPAATCFCASMGTGPGVGDGFDIALTELCEPDRHVFVARAGSEAGAEVLAQIEQKKADEKTLAEAAEKVEAAAGSMKRAIDRDGLREILYEAFEHPQWDHVAQRCLSCGNCTLSCPTCFCVTSEDSSAVTGLQAERWRKWDSCFTQSFSYIHGGSVRQSSRSRYRQWLTHKLAAWVDQFGSTGCVGCGRCITWCPAGIDITEEASALREPAPVSAHGG